MTKRILITGASGQLGLCLQADQSHWPASHYIFASRQQADITQRDSLQQLIRSTAPDVVINCAAYTAVDNAEHEAQQAWHSNADAVAHLAALCQQHGSSLVHISTDYVFAGTACKPYHEVAPVAPVNSYGRSKLAGEQAIITSGANAVIIRTGWLYSEFKQNFCNTMLKLGAQRQQLNVVTDQVGTPTYARDLAAAILHMVHQPQFVDLASTQRVYHFANEGVASWYDFAHSIMQLAGLSCQITPIFSADYPTAARRPHYSVLDKQRIKTEFAVQIQHWRDALARCLINRQQLTK